MRRGVLVGSIAVHALLAALLYAVHRRAPSAPPPRPPIDIEVIDVAPPAPAAPAVPNAGGGSTSGAPVPAPPTAPAAPTPPPAAAAPPPPPARSAAPPLAPAAPSLAITGYDRGDTLARDPGDGGTGTGAGGGFGDGLGRGAGPGAASLASLASLPPPPPPPAPPVERPPSKARPPRLVYPARDREGEESEMFIARLTVDTDGYVVGARLVRGRGNGPRDDDVAASAVWRFRYAPALDDEGRAIRATIEQRFLVDR